MVATVKCDTIVNAASTTNNLSLDASGNVTIGNNLTVAGTTTLTSPLAVANGGTGLASLTAGYIPFGAGTSAFGNSANLFWDNTNGYLRIGPTNQVLDSVNQPRPLVVQSSSTATTAGSSTNAITICNSDTTTNNLSQINFAAITGASTNQYSAAWIACQYGARTNAQYPTGQLIFATSTSLNSAPSEKMRIDNAGNVGIGTVPSAWTTLSALEFTGGAVATYSNTQMFIVTNSYYSSGAWKYRASTTAGQYLIDANAHKWFNAPSGTAGNSISFTQAMTLDSSGNLLVGTTSSSGRTTITPENATTPALSLDGGTYKVTVANNANATAFNSISMDGALIYIRDSTITGRSAIAVVNNASIVILGQSSAGFYVSSTTPSAGTVGIAWGGSNYRIYNAQGNQITFQVSTIRLA